MEVQSYLIFNGRCEEAIDFYKKSLGAKVEMLMRFKENPDKEKMGADCVPPGGDDKVMHSSFKIGDTVVMASDGMSYDQKPEFKGFSLTVTAKDDAEADKLFNALANGGKVQMPLGKTFFAKRFGAVADRFGVGWMVIVEA
jgi:PhnB protein